MLALVAFVLFFQELIDAGDGIGFTFILGQLADAFQAGDAVEVFGLFLGQLFFESSQLLLVLFAFGLGLPVLFKTPAGNTILLT